jgi:tRNA(Ile2) C34 agmatinyltransferase TiaS
MENQPIFVEAIPYCKECDLEFSTIGDYERHKCNYCGALFYFDLSLDLHLEKEHNQPL